jgi:hypothetical protein
MRVLVALNDTVVGCSVGFFASGLGKFGAIAGFFSVLDSIFHVYCLKK